MLAFNLFTQAVGESREWLAFSEHELCRKEKRKAGWGGGRERKNGSGTYVIQEEDMGKKNPST